jgi:hypothetical protein
MRLDSNPASSSASTSTSTPNGKRSRDPEDEVYLDNLNSHKRYLSEVCPFFLFFNSCYTFHFFRILLRAQKLLTLLSADNGI